MPTDEGSKHALTCTDGDCTGCLDSVDLDSVDEVKPTLGWDAIIGHVQRDYKDIMDEQLKKDLLITKYLPRTAPVRLSWWGRLTRFLGVYRGRIKHAWWHVRHGDCYDYYDD